MRASHPPFERQNQIVPLTAQLPSGKVRHRLGRGAALDQSLQHGAPGNPEDVAGDACQLDVGRLQELQEPVALGRLALHQLAAIAQQLAQFALRSRRNEALGNQPMADQIGDPLGTLHIGPATRHVTDMPGIADDEVEMPFQQGIDWAPVNAGALDADLLDRKLLQSVPQRFQIARHRPKGPERLLQPLARSTDQDAGNDRLLMHVKPGATAQRCSLNTIARGDRPRRHHFHP